MKTAKELIESVSNGANPRKLINLVESIELTADGDQVSLSYGNWDKLIKKYAPQWYKKYNFGKDPHSAFSGVNGASPVIPARAKELSKELSSYTTPSSDDEDDVKEIARLLKIDGVKQS